MMHFYEYFFLDYLAFYIFFDFSCVFMFLCFFLLIFPETKKRFRRKLVCVQIRSVGLSSNPFSREMSVIFQECRFFPFWLLLLLWGKNLF